MYKVYIRLYRKNDKALYVFLRTKNEVMYYFDMPPHLRCETCVFPLPFVLNPDRTLITYGAYIINLRSVHY